MATDPAHRLLAAPELLELILLQLDHRTLLCRASLVCCQWRDLITRSVKLQQKLFLRPIKATSDDLDELEALSTSVIGLIDKTEVQRLAAKLLATLFYYDPVGSMAQQANGTWMSTGMIRCRIPNDTRELTALGTLMRKRNTVRFIIRNESGKVQVLEVEDDVMVDMINGKFTLPPIEIDVQQRSTNVDMMLSFDRMDRNSISGFPRALGNIGNKANRHRIALSSQRSEHGSTRSSLRSRSTAQSWQPPEPVP